MFIISLSTVFTVFFPLIKFNSFSQRFTVDIEIHCIKPKTESNLNNALKCPEQSGTLKMNRCI